MGGHGLERAGESGSAVFLRIDPEATGGPNKFILLPAQTHTESLPGWSMPLAYHFPPLRLDITVT